MSKNIKYTILILRELEAPIQVLVYRKTVVYLND